MGFYIFSYFCAVIFLAAVACRVYRQLTLPVHVRWELYPVWHEKPVRSAYGGSYMEEPDWWTRPYEPSAGNAMKYMAPEILLLRGLLAENKRLWLVSFPFHLGLYLMLATTVLLLMEAAFMLVAPSPADFGGMLRTGIGWLIVALGWIGLITGLIGALGLLYRRLTDADLKRYATPADYFNLLFILAFFLAAISAAFSDPFFDGAKAYLAGLLTAGTFMSACEPGQSFSGALTILLASLLAAYIPLTHMSHMFMKYFLYHQVKWDDEPNRPGNAVEAAVLRNLHYRPSWSAKHVEADGSKSWKDIASSAPKETK
ncbi:MAG TPA: respiratory nitrate reductase subunit gamma [Smithellaceae bacterium]|nr:respiratory nitrate reductase subunit gamma [Smithellaceae bacterium]HRS81848.1 respiratory nitrate reductase subunit gamma [Smithellaceae bacterium]HRV45602.1 respiratory nitrate reductase subunit gamma [Smithellaceae bacterium]